MVFLLGTIVGAGWSQGLSTLPICWVSPGLLLRFFATRVFHGSASNFAAGLGLFSSGLGSGVSGSLQVSFSRKARGYPSGPRSFIPCTQKAKPSLLRPTSLPTGWFHSALYGSIWPSLCPIFQAPRTPLFGLVLVPIRFPRFRSNRVFHGTSLLVPLLALVAAPGSTRAGSPSGFFCLHSLVFRLPNRRTRRRNPRSSPRKVVPVRWGSLVVSRADTAVLLWVICSWLSPTDSSFCCLCLIFYLHLDNQNGFVEREIATFEGQIEGLPHVVNPCYFLPARCLLCRSSRLSGTRTTSLSASPVPLTCSPDLTVLGTRWFSG